jgi:phage-related protein (TIGR01555 family)
LKKIKKNQKQDPSIRFDGLANVLTGLGGRIDPQRNNMVFRERGEISQAEARTYYVENHYMATAIESLPNAIMAQGITVSVDGESEEFMRILRSYGVFEAFNRADIQARTFGGSGLILNIDDGREDHEPVNLDSIKSISILSSFERHRFNSGVCQLPDPDDDNFWPEPMRRPIERDLNLPTESRRIHASRIIEFYGIEPIDDDALREVDFWGHSIISRLKKTHDNLENNDSTIAILISKFIQTYYRMRGLRSIVNSTDGAKFLGKVFETFVTSESILGLKLIDQDDEINRVAIPTAGIDELHDRSIQAFCAAARIPVTRLMGTTTKGFSSDDKAGQANWNEQVSGRIEKVYFERLRYLCELIQRAEGIQGELNLVANPVEQATEKEQFDALKVKSESLAIAYDRGVISKDEYRANLDGSAGIVLKQGSEDGDDGDLVEFDGLLNEEISINKDADDLMIRYRLDSLQQWVLDTIEEELDLVPTEAMGAAAERGLRYHEKGGRKGLTRAGLARANQLKRRERLSIRTLMRMKSFLARHEKSSKIGAGKEPWEDRGHIAWLVWGGDPAKAWVDRKVAQLERIREREKPKKDSSLDKKWSEFEGMRSYAKDRDWSPADKAEFVRVYNLEFDRLTFGVVDKEAAEKKAGELALKAVEEKQKRRSDK